MEEKFERFMVGQKVILIRDGKVLILETASFPGLWELPGGRINKGELKDEALRREIKEELGFDKFDILRVIDYDVWYHTDTNTPFCATVHLIKNDLDEIVLSPESLQHKWIAKNEINNYKYFWDATPRFIEKGFELYELLNAKPNEK